jgi:HK97 gp10 family phage protein
VKVTAKVIGFKEFEAALQELDKVATRKTVARNALKKAGEPVAAKMRSLAPVDDGVLSRSIAVSTKIKGEAGKAAYAQTMRNTSGNKAMAVKAMRDARRDAKGTMPPVMMFVGPTTEAYQAHLVEFGTAPHINAGKFAGTKHPGTAPQPFARPAWDATSGTALDLIGDTLKAEIMRAAARQAKRRAKGG